LNLLRRPALARDDATMNHDPRHSTVARIGRSYPRPWGAEASAEAHPPVGGRRYRVAGALIVVFSALGFLGWLLAR
jgi:hypothetical protein